LGVPSERGADPADVRLFFHLGCESGVLTIVTSQDQIYAELPCDRTLPRDVVEQYLGKPVQIRIVPGEQWKLFLLSDGAGSVEFTPGRVWLVPPG
jgi:hypothetical protein